MSEGSEGRRRGGGTELRVYGVPIEGRRWTWWERVRLWFRPIRWSVDPLTPYAVGMKEMGGRWYVVAERRVPGARGGT